MHLRSGRRGSFLGHRRKADEGFTLLEVVIAVTIAAVVFMAVAAILGAGLKTLAVQKARTQGNEVATQGIEDLQRYSYNSLELCAAPSGPVPSGFGLSVLNNSPSTKCPVGSTAATGDEPCVPPTGTPKLIPRAEYTCTRNSINFQVRRFIAWTDAGHTAKRLAVLVRWTDLVGPHEVSQQSSLRAPVSGDILGIDPPSFTSPPTILPPPTPDSREHQIDPLTGYLTSSISISAQTNGVTASDRVFVSFRTLEDGNLVTSTVALTFQSTNNWAGSIPTGGPTVFPTGSQYFSFTAVRASDGKTGSIVDTATSRFCPSSGCPAGSPSFTLTGPAADRRVPQSVPSDTVAIDEAGALDMSNGGGTGNVTITATTQNLTNLDSVSFQFVTKTGTVNTAMVPDGACSVTSCTWTGTIARASGYSFSPGTQSLYFLASQTGGATGAARSIDLNFVAP